MSNLPARIHPQSRSLARLDRHIERELSEIHRRALVARGVDRARADLAQARVGDIQAVTVRSLMAATEIAVAEAACSRLTPHAAARINQIASVGTAAIAQNLLDFGQGR